MLWRRLGLQINPFTEWNAYYTWHFLFRISLFSKAIERNLLNVKEKILNKFVCLLPSIYDSEVPSQKFWRTSISSLKKKKNWRQVFTLYWKSGGKYSKKLYIMLVIRIPSLSNFAGLIKKTYHWTSNLNLTFIAPYECLI